MRAMRPMKPLKPLKPMRRMPPIKAIDRIPRGAITYGACTLFSSVAARCPLCRADVEAYVVHTCVTPRPRPRKRSRR